MAFFSLVAIVFASASSFKSLLVASAKPVAHLDQPHRFASNLLADLEMAPTHSTMPL
jgi:hypothetical protein